MSPSINGLRTSIVVFGYRMSLMKGLPNVVMLSSFRELPVVHPKYQAVVS